MSGSSSDDFAKTTLSHHNLTSPVIDPTSAHPKLGPQHPSFEKNHVNDHNTFMFAEKTVVPRTEMFGNAGAVGMAAFATSQFVAGLCLTGPMGIKSPSIALGLCFFHAGLVQAAAGVWEMFLGNTFAATSFCSYGMGYWMSYGAMNVDAFGIKAAYGDDIDQMNNAFGLYFLGWGIFSYLLFLCTFKTTLIFMGVFFNLGTAYFLVAAFYFSGVHAVLTAGGVFFVLASFCGWFCAFAGVATSQNSYIVPVDIQLPKFGSSS